MTRRPILLLACAALTACSAAPAASLPGLTASATATLRSGAVQPEIAEFSIQTKSVVNAAPFQIARGGDGAMWFTEEGAGAIGRIDVNGRIEQFPIPSSDAQPEGIAAAPDGSLYFAENTGPSQYSTHLARITTRGTIAQWSDDNYMPEGVAAGPGGSMWFTQGCGGLAVVSPGGAVRQYDLSGVPAETPAIAQGPDHAMWFALDGTARIGRIASDGALTVYRGLYYHGVDNDLPNGVAAGPDGNLWWTAAQSNVIWATNPHGRIVAKFSIPTKNSWPWGITAGPDGALWFTEWNGNKIGRVTTAGAFSEFALPTRGARPQGIAAGPDGSIWFVESQANKIGRIRL